jgi:serine/threonine protein kinase
MEYLTGSDLRRTLDDGGPLPVALACSYARQAALGLQHAHENGLVHRDVKPDNLMVTTGDVVKLLDLGLVRVFQPPGPNGSAAASSVTVDGAPLGTPDYMAPEQARNPRGVDVRADVYSLGCTLYEMLAGRPPFDGGSVMQKLYRHQREQPRPIDGVRRDVPAALAAAVARMLAKEPADRFAAPREVADQLAAFG